MALHAALLKGLKLKPKSSKKEKTHLRVVRDDEPPSLVEIVESYAARQRTARTGFFRPSMLFGCDRANVFHYQMVREEEQKHDGRMVRILDTGSALHELIQDKYLSSHPDYWFVKEPKVDLVIHGARVKGSCDGVMIHRRSMYKWGIEIKTINHEEFMRLVKPKDEHVFQANIYMTLQQLKYMTIFYWDKGASHIKEFHVRRSKTLREELQERLEYLMEYVEGDELPEYDKGTCNKSFCRYVRHCRKMGAPV